MHDYLKAPEFPENHYLDLYNYINRYILIKKASPDSSFAAKKSRPTK